MAATETNHPRTVYNFIGNEQVEEEIFNTLNSQRMHHAWIFHGPKGVGKATMAYRVARYFLGAKTTGLSPLATEKDDHVSVLIENESNPDVRIASHYCPEEEKLKNVVSVHAIREMNALFQRRATNQFGRRIAIVEDADDLNDNSANALLKTLEEPPPGGLIILIVNSLGSILPTIRSRCRIFEFRPISANKLRQSLPDVSIAAIILSSGAYGNALRLQNYDIEELYRNFSNAISAFPKQNSEASLKFAGFASDKEKADIALSLVSNWIKRAIKSAIGLQIDEIEPGESANMARIISHFSEDEIYNLTRIIDQMDKQIETNLDKVAAILNLVNSFFEPRGLN